MRSRERRSVLRIVWVVAAGLVICTVNAQAFAAADEFRAAAASRFQWPSTSMDACKTYIDTMMQKLQDNNFNAVILQMRGQCDTLYPSPYEPWSPIVSSDGNTPTGWGDFDPMAYAINKAHEHGLEFHAYLNACVAWGGSTEPNYCPSHAYWQHANVADPAHRDWLLCNSSGTPVGFTTEYVYVAPGVPNFQAYWRKQIMYVVEHYNGSDPITRPAVDGVHFDRARLPSPDYSYDPISQSRRLGEGNPAGLSFGDWTADQITRMLTDLYAQVNEYTQNISPTQHRVKVSSAPLGLYLQERYPGYPSYFQYARSQCYQDAQAWLAVGAQDFICPQIYWEDPPYQTAPPYFSDVLPDWLYHNSGRHVYPFCNVSATAPGLIDENTAMRNFVDQIGQGNAYGSVIWTYGGLTSTMWSSFLSGPYAEPANTPAMPWKDTPTDAIILGTVTDGTNPITDAHITRNGTTYTALSSEDGLYSFLKVPPGTYTLAYSKTGLNGTTREVTVVAGQVLRVPEVILSSDIPPQISNVQATGITDTAATITWATDTASTSQVHYGTTTSYGSSTPLDSNRVTSHSVNLSGLTPNTLYHYQVTSTNDYGTSSSSDYTFTTAGPPTISNVQVTAISQTSATVTWATNHLSTSQVLYGLTSSYGSQSALDSTLVTSHSVVVSGLQANTTYHFAAVSTNAYPPPAQSSDATFTTLPPPPVISNVQSGNIGDNTATITWNTDVAATSQVEYGTTTSYGQTTTLDGNLVTAHSVNLSGLAAGTLYHYRVISSASGGSSTSGDFTFTTTGTQVGPVISSVAAGNWDAVTSSSLKVTITWTTDIPADSQVQYGLTSAYGSSTTLDPALVTAHSVILTGLAQSTTYHYRVRSASDGGTSYSGDYTFTTGIVIDNVDSGCVQNPAGSWTTGTNSLVPKIGSSYLYKAGSTSGTSTVRWTPSISSAGNYDVYVYYQMGTNRNSAATFTIFYNGGQASSVQNQYRTVGNQGAWFKLNATPLPFAAGTGGYVQVSDNSPDSQLVSADAAMFMRVSGGDTEAPTVPTNVQAVALSTTSIQLTWTASTDNVAVSGYKIYRNGGYLASSTTNSYTDTDLSPNTSYSYEISAYDAVPNESARSGAAARATLSVPPTPSTVTCDRAVNTWYGTSTFTFTAVGGFGAGKITKYKYAWDQSDTHAWSGSEAEWSAGTLACNASANGNWYLHVQGYNSDGVANGAAGLGLFKFDGTPPTAPVVTDDGVTTDDLAGLHAVWAASDPETGIQKYEYQIRDGAGGIIRDWTDVGAATSISATGLSLEVGKTYFFRVRASNTVNLVSAEGVSDGILVFPLDTNNDGALNDADIAEFVPCAAAGPDVPYPTGGSVDCARFNSDGDIDIDVDDFGVFQRCMTGAGVIDPACLE